MAVAKRPPLRAAVAALSFPNVLLAAGPGLLKRGSWLSVLKGLLTLARCRLVLQDRKDYGHLSRRPVQNGITHVSCFVTLVGEYDRGRCQQMTHRRETRTWL